MTKHSALSYLAEASADELTQLSSPTALAADDVSIDQQAGLIRGASVMTVGPATGHGFRITSRSLDSLVSAWQAADDVRVRFTHPELAGSDGADALLGRPENLRRDGNQVRANIRLKDFANQSPRGRLKDYVLAVANEDPRLLGLSVVGRIAREDPNDQESQESPMPVAIVETLRAIDVVGDPAANRNGLLSTSTTGATMNPQLLQFLKAKGLIDDSARQRSASDPRHQSAQRQRSRRGRGAARSPARQQRGA